MRTRENRLPYGLLMFWKDFSVLGSSISAVSFGRIFVVNRTSPMSAMVELSAAAKVAAAAMAAAAAAAELLFISNRLLRLPAGRLCLRRLRFVDGDDDVLEFFNFAGSGNSGS